MNMHAIDAAVATLDLQTIKQKLMHGPSGEGWQGARADAVEVEYRRFLTLMKMFPNDCTAPLVDVDTFWHYHILDTAKYAADCNAVFGYFLHHYPYLGMEADGGEAIRSQAGARLRDIYQATFGQPYGVQGAAWCGIAAKAAWCGVAARSAWCGVAAKPAAGETAWCGIASKPAAAETAWCGVAPGAKVVVTIEAASAEAAAPVRVC